jgi:hypothetical protein
MTKILATLCGVREIVTPGDEALKIAAVIKFGRPCHIFLRVGWSPFLRTSDILALVGLRF